MFLVGWVLFFLIGLFFGLVALISSDYSLTLQNINEFWMLAILNQFVLILFSSVCLTVYFYWNRLFGEEEEKSDSGKNKRA